MYDMTSLLKKIHKRITRKVTKRLYPNRYYNWYVFSRQLTHALQQQVMPHYPTTLSSPNSPDVLSASTSPAMPHTTVERASTHTEPTVVAIHNGWTESGGLADRLKGIVSTYQLCQEMHLPFRIHFTHPFPLELFLVPNTYDWCISPSQLCFTQPQTLPVCLEIGSESPWQQQRQKQYLQHAFQKAQSTQIHVYTNAMFACSNEFGKAFHELFRPSERLQNAINRQLDFIGQPFVSVSARFMGSLGDFTDTMPSAALPPNQQQQLTDACLRQIEHIRKNHPDTTILVNSDSATFLQYAHQLPNTYTIPGRILHLDVKADETSMNAVYETYEKTLLDFFMIAHAQTVYRLKGPGMHCSGFPHVASLIGGKPFHSITFTL